MEAGTQQRFVEHALFQCSCAPHAMHACIKLGLLTVCGSHSNFAACVVLLWAAPSSAGDDAFSFEFWLFTLWQRVDYVAVESVL